MTNIFLLIFYHVVLTATGIRTGAPPTVLVAKTSVEACRMRGPKKDGKHRDVEILEVGVMDSGDQSPYVRPAVLVCEGD